MSDLAVMDTDLLTRNDVAWQSSAAEQIQPRQISGLAYEVDTISDREWDAVVAEFDDLSLEQTASYTTPRWGAERNSHLIVREKGEIVAAARVVLLTMPVLSKGIAYVKFGPLWRRRDRDPDIAIYKFALEALAEEYCEHRGLLLTTLPRPSPDNWEIESDALAACDYAVRRPYADKNRYFVNLELDEEAQRASLGQKWRYNLRKAEKSNLIVKLIPGEEGIRLFQALHGEMVERKNASHGDAVDLLPGLQASLPAAVAPQVILAFRDGIPIAGAAVAVHGDTVYYIYGASGAEALPLRAGYALQWWIVRWLSGQGARWYDLGGTAGDRGLKQFKAGLVGKAGAVVEMSGEFDRWSCRRGRVTGDVLFALRSCAQGLAKFRSMWRLK
jgi:hypothetical protein